MAFCWRRQQCRPGRRDGISSRRYAVTLCSLLYCRWTGLLELNSCLHDRWDRRPEIDNEVAKRQQVVTTSIYRTDCDSKFIFSLFAKTLHKLFYCHTHCVPVSIIFFVIIIIIFIISWYLFHCHRGLMISSAVHLWIRASLFQACLTVTFIERCSYHYAINVTRPFTIKSSQIWGG